MRDGHNGCRFWLRYEEDAERKPVNDGPTTFLEDQRKPFRPVFDPHERGPQFIEEFCPEAFLFSVVPGGRVEGVKFSLRPDAEDRHLSACSKVPLDAIDGLSPRLGLVGSTAMRREPLLQEGLLPLLERNLVNRCGDAIPQ